MRDTRLLPLLLLLLLLTEEYQKHLLAPEQQGTEGRTCHRIAPKKCLTWLLLLLLLLLPYCRWLLAAAYWLLLPLAAGDWLGAVLPYRIVVVVVRNCLLSYSLARSPLRLPGSADRYYWLPAGCCKNVVLPAAACLLLPAPACCWLVLAAAGCCWLLPAAACCCLLLLAWNPKEAFLDYKS